VSKFDERNVVIALKGYTAYFDASVDAERRIPDISTVVAGFISSVELWERWEADWRIALAELDVPYFHMKEFTACKKAYKDAKWRSERYRARFLSTLVEITNSLTLLSIATSTRRSLFDYQNLFFRFDERFNPYVLSGVKCALEAQDFVRRTLKSDLPIAYIFDRGDEGWPMLVKEMENSGLPSPSRKHSRPDPKIDDPPAIQLQACDLLAWELRRGKLDGLKAKKRRRSLQALIQFPSRKKWFEIHNDALVELIKIAKIPIREGMEAPREYVSCSLRPTKDGELNQ
jgi:hypothetical protein